MSVYKRALNARTVSVSGTVLVPGGATATTTQTVTFDDEFESAPVILVSMTRSAGTYVCCSGSDATTGFIATVFRTDGANATADRTVAWVAIGTLA